MLEKGSKHNIGHSLETLTLGLGERWVGKHKRNDSIEKGQQQNVMCESYLDPCVNKPIVKKAF